MSSLSSFAEVKDFIDDAIDNLKKVQRALSIDPVAQERLNRPRQLGGIRPGWKASYELYRWAISKGQSDSTLPEMYVWLCQQKQRHPSAERFRKFPKTAGSFAQNVRAYTRVKGLPGHRRRKAEDLAK